MTAFDDRVAQVSQILVAAGYSSHDNPNTLVEDLTSPAEILGHTIKTGMSLRAMYGWEVTYRDGQNFRPEAPAEMGNCDWELDKVVANLQALLKDIPGIKCMGHRFTTHGRAGYIWKKYNAFVHVQRICSTMYILG